MTADSVKKLYGCLVCVAVVGIALAAPTAVVKLPEGYIQCTKNDPEVAECLTRALQSSLHPLIKGVPTLGLLPIDPLRITELGIDQGSGPVSIKLNFRDLDILNIGTGKINKIHADMDNHNITLQLDFKKPIVLDGHYDIKGKVMILPITGSGKSQFVLENIKVKANVYLNTVQKKGNTYYNIKDLKLTFTTTKLRIKLENLFNGDKALGDNMNTFLNENWQDILKELQESIENALAMAFASIAKEFFSRVPANKVFKD